MKSILRQTSELKYQSAITEQLMPWVEICAALLNAIIISLCCGLLGSFWVSKINPIFVTIFGSPVLCLLFYFLLYKKKPFFNPQSMTGRAWICALILAALISGGVILRYPTSAHIHGGQDQGSYFNIAAWIANHGSYERHDQLLSDAFRKKWPFRFNLIWNPYKSGNGPQKIIPGEYEGERFVGGFTVKDREKGLVVPQFYPLTPLLLATGHWIFGGKHTSDILPIFGILSVISIGLLTFRMFKSVFVSVLTFVVLLFSGLEVFFSTFPVSEIISQYFLFTGMWLVTRTLKEDNYTLPILAGINFTMAFFNHLTVSFYLAPMVVFFVLYRFLSIPKVKHRRFLTFYYIFLVGLLFSLISARFYNGYYVYRNLKENMTFLEAFSIEGVFVMLFGSVLIAACVPLLVSSRLWNRLEGRANCLRMVVLFGLVLITLAIFIKLLLLKFGIIPSEPGAYTYFSSITAHISPIGWGVLLWGLITVALREDLGRVLFPILVLMWFSFIFLFLQFFTEYQWYFARYYVQEVYPLAIIFICYGLYRISKLSVLKGVTGKATGIVLGLALVIYSAYPNLYIFRQPFLEGAYSAMTDLDSQLEKHSMILIVQGRDRLTLPDSELRLSVPLVYSFGHDVVWLPLQGDLKQMTEIVTHYLELYKRHIYVLYVGGRPLAPNLLPRSARYVTRQLHQFVEPERAKGIPKRHWPLAMGIYLYEL